ATGRACPTPPSSPRCVATPTSTRSFAPASATQATPDPGARLPGAVDVSRRESRRLVAQEDSMRRGPNTLPADSRRRTLRTLAVGALASAHAAAEWSVGTRGAFAQG